LGILQLTLLGCDAHQRARAQVPELSGLVASLAHPGVFWAHGDSGTEAMLFAVDEHTRTLARVRVDGAKNHDWEDLTLDAHGNLYIGDIGNNDSDREDLTIYVLPEPDPKRAEQRVTVARTIRFRYPDQRDASGVRKSAQNFDAEALFVVGEQLYIATKHHDDAHSTLYRVPLSETSSPVTLERVADLDVQMKASQHKGQVTSASASPDGQHVALLTYKYVLLFRVNGEHVLEGPVAVDKAPKVDKLEALTWDAKGLLVASEKGDLTRVPVPSGAKKAR
jgi:hypothetical protein